MGLARSVPGRIWLFGWGAVHSQNEIPKEAARLSRCFNFLYRLPEIKYKPKPVVFVIPTSNKAGSSACRMALVCENTMKILGRGPRGLSGAGRIWP